MALVGDTVYWKLQVNSIIRRMPKEVEIWIINPEGDIVEKRKLNTRDDLIEIMWRVPEDAVMGRYFIYAQVKAMNIVQKVADEFFVTNEQYHRYKFGKDIGAEKIIDIVSSIVKKYYDTLTGVDSVRIAGVGTGDVGRIGEIIPYLRIEKEYVDLALHYHFDEGSGNIVLDASGNRRSGTIYGTVNWMQGKFNVALDFNGVDTYVETMPFNLSGNEISVECWIYPRGHSAGGFGGIVNNINGAGNRRLLIKDSGLLLAQVTGTSFYSNTAVSMNDWHHIVYTFDGNEERWYIDGQLDATNSVSASLSSGSLGWYVGLGYDSGTSKTYYLDGIIDELRIYDRVLSEDEVYELYVSPVWFDVRIGLGELSRAREVITI